MKRAISTLLAVLIGTVIPVLSVTAENAVPVSAVNNETKQLSVSTNITGPKYFVDSAGTPVNLFGMARCQAHSEEEDCQFGGNAGTLAEHYYNLGMNYMRLAIDISDIAGDTITDSLLLTTDEQIDEYIYEYIDPDVKAIIGEGMYVGLDMHMYAPVEISEGVYATAQETTVYAEANYLPVLKRLAAVYKDEPMIANIEIWNEPNYGANSTAPFDSSWNTALRDYFIDAVEEIRQIDGERVLMVSDSNAGWGSNIDNFWNGYYDDLGDNVVFSAHVSKDQFSEQSDYISYSDWVKNVANTRNICIVFNEVEDEPETSTDASIENFCEFLENSKNTYHFSGCLWRPRTDYVNRTHIWGSNGWAASYTGVSLNLGPVLNWFKADGYNESGGELSQTATVQGNGNAVSAAGGIAAYTKEYAAIQNARCDIAGGDIIFSKNNYYSLSESQRVPTDLTGYEYVIVKLRFADEGTAGHALSAVGSGDPFIRIDGAEAVSFADYKSALTAAADNAEKLKWVTLVLPLSQDFNGCYNLISIDMGYSGQTATETHFYTIDFATEEYAVNYDGICGSDNLMELDGGPDYEFNVHNSWYPQLNLSAWEDFTVYKEYTAISFDIEFPDYTYVKNSLIPGSRSSLGGGTFSYNPSYDLGIYFSGTDVSGIGITQTELFGQLSAYETALSAGQKVRLTLPITGNFIDGGKISSVNIMISHGQDASVLDGKSISVSGIEFIRDEIILENSPDYIFTSNAWQPQLTVETKNAAVITEASNKLCFDIKLPDIEVLRPNMIWGSNSSLGGGGISYGPDDFAVYFSGENVSSIGITQGDFFAALDENTESLAAGETVTLTLDIKGNIKDYGRVTAVSIMVTHGESAAVFGGKPVSISNIKVISSRLVLDGGPDYVFNGDNWYPQLSVRSSEGLNVSGNYNRIKLKLRIPDILILRPNMSAGSRMSVGGGEFTYNADTDLGIYFSGTGVSGAGVSQTDLFNAFDSNSQALAAGETVEIILPVSGVFAEGGKITGINIMLAHDSAASVFEGKSVSITEFEFYAEAGEDLNSDGRINSLDAILLKNYLFGFEADIKNLNKGDINGDGNTNVLDYILLRKAILDIY